MDPSQILDLLLQANRLKNIPRTGWLIRGITQPENVAAHSYGVAFLCLVLSQAVKEPLNREKLLITALLHDLPESHITDIPYPAMRFIPPQAKRRAEERALEEMLPDAAFDSYRQLWLDFEDRRTPEGRLVRDADRLELLIQAYTYELNTGNRQMHEFWDNSSESYFEYPISRQLFSLLESKREQEKNQ